MGEAGLVWGMRVWAVGLPWRIAFRLSALRGGRGLLRGAVAHAKRRR